MIHRKKIGVRKVANGAANVGKVKEIRMGASYSDAPDDGSARVTVQFGEPPKQKKDKHGMMMGSYSEPKRSELYVPADVARKLHIGQKVRVCIEPV